MATAEQYADWIVKNKDKKGTPEFETVAEAYKVARNEPVATQEAPKQEGYRLSSPSMGNLVTNAKTLGAGMLAGAADIGDTLINASTYIPRQIGNVASKLSGQPNPIEQMNQNRTQGLEQFNQRYEGDPVFGAGKLATQIAGTAGVGDVLAVGATAAKMPKLAASLKSSGFSLGKEGGNRAVNAATRVAGAAGAGGAATGLVNPEDAAKGALIAGALPVVGKVAGEAGKAVGKSIAGQATPEIVDLAAKANKLGIDIPADRLTNSKPLNAVAASLNYVPFSGRAKTEETFEKQLNTALSKTFGQNTDNITMGLRKAASELGHKFDNTLKSNVVKFDKQFLDDILTTQNQAASELSDQGLQVVNRQIDEIAKKGADGVIDGQAAYNIKRTLDRIGKGNTPEAFHARQLKKDLMNALDRSLGEKGAKEFANVRKQYGTMIDLENIAQNGAEGGISIARLANMKNIKNNELQDLADIAAQFLKPREGQHGAAQRAVVGAMTAGLGGAPALATGAAIGRMANTALNSQTAKKMALGQYAKSGVNPKLIAGSKAIPIAATYD